MSLFGGSQGYLDIASLQVRKAQIEVTRLEILVEFEDATAFGGRVCVPSDCHECKRENGTEHQVERVLLHRTFMLLQRGLCLANEEKIMTVPRARATRERATGPRQFEEPPGFLEVEVVEDRDRGQSSQGLRQHGIDFQSFPVCSPRQRHGFERRKYAEDRRRHE